MAYGDRRQQIATDTFDSSITADWTNPIGSANSLAWVTGGHVGPASDNDLAVMARDAESYQADQYSIITIQEQTRGGGVGTSALAPIVRASLSAETAYAGEAITGSLGTEFRIQILIAGVVTRLGTLPTSEVPLTVGEKVTIEVEATTIRVGSDSGGSDVQKLTNTDATLASGSPGLYAFETDADDVAQITAWEGGNILTPPPSRQKFRDTKRKKHEGMRAWLSAKAWW